MAFCPITGRGATEAELAEVRWLAPKVIQYIQQSHPGWTPDQGACPAFVQQMLLEILLDEGESAFHQSVQTQFPLDAEAAFGAIPTPLRLHADVRYSGKGVTIAMIDSDFFPHPDLIYPTNRIRAFVDAAAHPPIVYNFGVDEVPDWQGASDGRALQWHGTMTTVVAAGNGWQSHGLYRGLASDAQVVLIKTYAEGEGITNEAILRALSWLLEHAAQYSISVANLSIGSNFDRPIKGNPIDSGIQALVDAGISVTAAAGNDGARRLIPPASSPAAITVGGLDDNNDFDHETRQLWHSSYGQSTTGSLKPELVAPSIWVVAPVLPHTETAEEAVALFEQRGDADAEERIAELKLVTPFYQHVDGTSFAAPLVASTIACMIEANPKLTPSHIRALLIETSEYLPEVSRELQGNGVLMAGRAVAMVCRESLHTIAPFASPVIEKNRIRLMLHDHHAGKVEVFGSWDNWSSGAAAVEFEPGIWTMEFTHFPMKSLQYKFLVDGSRWIDDPLNPRKIHDRYGGFNSLITHEQLLAAKNV